MTPTRADAGYAAGNFALIVNRILNLAGTWIEGDNPTNPLRKYVSAGVPAWDLDACGQLVIYPTVVVAGYPGLGQGGRPDPGPNVGRTYGLTLELARCIATVEDGGGSPSTALLEADGAQMLADYRLLDLFVASLGPNSKIQDPNLISWGLQAVAPGAVNTVQPQGGMVAVRVTFTVVV